ncbi:MAG TPA: TlpA disulfide reductase family protein [Actinomycetota bacterium]|jgi:thiol-disulfide isomerase/thioredoxin
MKRTVIAASVAAGAVILALAFAPRPAPAPAVPLSGLMPPIEGAALAGGVVSPADYRGSVVVVNFWASWCAPCREEQPGLERLWREYRDDEVRFIGVNSMDIESDALAYLEEFGVTYPSVSDPSGDLMRRFGVAYLPATVIVDRGGALRLRLSGARDEAELRALIEEIAGAT